MRKSLLNVNMKLNFIVLLILLSISLLFSIPARIEGIENPNQPLIDRGDGYAVGVQPNKRPSDQSRDIQNKVINNIFDFLFQTGTQNVTPLPQQNIPPTVAPITGNPDISPTLPPNLPPNTGAGQYADEVVRRVHTYCIHEGQKGIVTSGNKVCLDSLNGMMSTAAINSFKNLPETQFIQCVGCAVSMALARNRPYYRIGNAKQQANQRVANYTYIPNSPAMHSTLIPGSLFIITTGFFGHIGYVTEIYKDRNGIPYAFRAFECNYGTNGIVRHDKIWPLGYPKRENYTNDQDYQFSLHVYSSLAGWQKPNSL